MKSKLILSQIFCPRPRTCFRNYSEHVCSDQKDNSSVKHLLNKWRQHFEKAAVDEPLESIENIIAHVLKLKNIRCVHKNPRRCLTTMELKQVEDFCNWRLKRMPIQYILGEWEFRKLTLKMQPPVFIPRPETEELVELVKTEIKTKKLNKVLELCCGSGAISVSLLSEIPEIEIVAIDQLKEACKLTEANAEKYGLSKRLLVLQETISESNNLLSMESNSLDLVVSNPPYVFSDDMLILQPEIFLYEDLKALEGGKDGLDVIKQILKLSSRLLKCERKLFMEVDPRHSEMIKNWLEANADLKLHYVRCIKDFCNKDRFVEIVKN